MLFYASMLNNSMEEKTNDKCDYGCGKQAEFTFKNGKHCCSEKYSDCVGMKATRKANNTAQRGRKKKVSFKPCQHCGKEVATNNLKKHETHCSGNGKDRKICEVCGATFHTYWPTKTCSDKCQSIRQSEKMKRDYAEGKLKPYGGNGCRRTITTQSGKVLNVMSSYEAEACVIFDSWLKAKRIKYWEYTADRFTYLDEIGEERTYFPDFKIVENDDSYYYLETKGFEKIRDRYKWDAVEQQGHKLVVWFKEDIIQHSDNKD